MRKLAIAAAVALLGFILWVIYMANTGRQTVFFELSQAVPYGDKIAHAALYGALALLLNVALRLHCCGIGSLRIYTGILLVSLFVVVEELAQGLISTRTLDALDIAADILGLALASAASYVLGQRQKRRLAV